MWIWRHGALETCSRRKDVETEECSSGDSLYVRCGDMEVWSAEGELET